MELVPILSTIILVGTIATFILAVAAYILYKIRERRARESAQPAAYMQPDQHILVAPESSMQIQQGQPAPATMYATPVAQQQQAPVMQRQQQQPQQQQQQQLQQAPQSQNSLFWEYTDEGFVPVNPQQEAPRAQAEARVDERQQGSQQDEGYAWL